MSCSVECCTLFIRPRLQNSTHRIWQCCCEHVLQPTLMGSSHGRLFPDLPCFPDWRIRPQSCRLITFRLMISSIRKNFCVFILQFITNFTASNRFIYIFYFVLGIQRRLIFTNATRCSVIVHKIFETNSSFRMK